MVDANVELGGRTGNSPGEGWEAAKEEDADDASRATNRERRANDDTLTLVEARHITAPWCNAHW